MLIISIIVTTNSNTRQILTFITIFFTISISGFTSFKNNDPLPNIIGYVKIRTDIVYTIVNHNKKNRWIILKSFLNHHSLIGIQLQQHCLN